jgi:dihydroorotate dehydrogenase
VYHIGDIEMNLPIIVGAGACKTPASIPPYMRADVSVGAVSTGSYTPDSRPPNEGSTLFWPESFYEFTRLGFGLNSFGMPNLGFEDAAKEFLPQYEHPVIASIAGFKVDHFVKGTEIFNALPGIAAVKLNLGCPNTGKIPFAYDPVSLNGILLGVSRLGIKKPLWLKLSPYITDEQREYLQEMYPHIRFSQVPVVEAGFLGEVLNIVGKYRFVRAVIFSNTLGNVIVRDAAGNPVTTPNGGKAGLSGNILKRISIDLIRRAATMLPDEVNLIASGGVVHGNDAVDYFEAGATAVCCTSGPFWSGNGPRFFADMLSGSERLQNHLTQYSQLKEA